MHVIMIVMLGNSRVGVILNNETKETGSGPSLSSFTSSSCTLISSIVMYTKYQYILLEQYSLFYVI